MSQETKHRIAELTILFAIVAVWASTSICILVNQPSYDRIVVVERGGVIK